MRISWLLNEMLNFFPIDITHSCTHWRETLCVQNSWLPKGILTAFNFDKYTLLNILENQYKEELSMNTDNRPEMILWLGVKFANASNFATIGQRNNFSVPIQYRWRSHSFYSQHPWKSLKNPGKSPQIQALKNYLASRWSSAIVVRDTEFQDMNIPSWNC